MIRTAFLLVWLLVLPAHAAGERPAALAAMSEAVAAWFAADFVAIEDRAGDLLATAPQGSAARVDAVLAVGFAASIAEAFDVGAQSAEASGAPGDDPALAFVRAFNKANHGAPLAALAIAEPILAKPTAPDAPVWRDLLAGVAGVASSAIGRHRDAVRLTGEARRAIAGRLGPDDPLATLARLWHLSALIAASAPDAEAELTAMLGILERRPGELPLLGMLLIHAGISVAPVEEIATMAQTVFDEALNRLPTGNTIIALALEDLAYAAAFSGDYARELEALSQAHAIYRESLVRDAPAIGSVVMGMAMASANLRDHDRAVQLADIALDLTRNGTGGTSAVTAGRFAEVATVSLLAGDAQRAVALLGNARRLFSRAGEEHWLAARVFIPMQEAKALMAAGRPAEAAEVHAALLADLATTHWAGGLAGSVVEADQALAFHAAGDTRRALAAARRALANLVAMRSTPTGVSAAGVFAGGGGAPTVSHSFRLTAQTLVRSAWGEAGK